MWRGALREDRIVASDEDLLRLESSLRKLGYIVVSSVPYPDEVILGGGGLSE